ncbi:hypothetical protein KIN20_017326 [Parelaphostrongylus tenuis]|uniref:Acetyl-CoA hydrolase n=1 Tax=Parelaphostrongylus tenuis TaxID=148309 RepID=A0AAD5N2Z2_PARTN|nr:hypothetical protein KIN20_017326 [Parelaphostrongylus tenuis]
MPVVGKSPKVVTADAAVANILSGSNIFVHGIASTPTELLEALCRRVDTHELKNIRLMHLLLIGNVPTANNKYFGKIRSNCLFLANNYRPLVSEGHADYIPIFLSDMPSYFYDKSFRVDVALMAVSSPDEHGFCTLGVSVDTAKAALEMAKMVIAIVSPKIPRTHGNSIVHQSHIDYIVESDQTLHGLADDQPSQEEMKIGQLIAENLVDNGATLQLGIGAIPFSTLMSMKHHKDLGIHTEMLGHSIMDLIERGVVNNAKKTVLPGRVVTSFALGTQKFYEYLHNNPLFHFDCCSWTNCAEVIRSNSKMTAINSGIEIDITGQVASDSIGTTFYSGFGGQTDFMTAAPTAYDGMGKSIMALPSRTTKGQSRITVTLAKGAGVVTTRGHTRYVVTEHGIASLGGKNVRQRAYELIKIAHPEDREQLEKASFERLKCMPSPD